MSKAEENRYSTFDLFRDKWALVTGGDIEHFNSCTVGWGVLVHCGPALQETAAWSRYISIQTAIHADL